MRGRAESRDRCLQDKIKQFANAWPLACRIRQSWHAFALEPGMIAADEIPMTASGASISSVVAPGSPVYQRVYA